MTKEFAHRDKIKRLRVIITKYGANIRNCVNDARAPDVVETIVSVITRRDVLHGRIFGTFE